MEVHRLLHPGILAHPLLAPWFLGVCAGLVPNPEPVARHVAALCTEAHTQVLLGIEGAQPRALLVTQLPTPLMLLPTVLLGYNEGIPALGKAMMQQACAWMRENGYYSFLAVNRGRNSAAYARGLRPFGEVSDAGTTFRVELREEEEDDAVRGGALGVPAA